MLSTICSGTATSIGIDLTARRCVELFLDMLATSISPGDLSADAALAPAHQRAW